VAQAQQVAEILVESFGAQFGSVQIRHSFGRSLIDEIRTMRPFLKD
jgi:hypothetical protein